jgi:hypothetical protein
MTLMQRMPLDGVSIKRITGNVERVCHEVDLTARRVSGHKIII